MKIAIVSDTHLSARNDLDVLLENHDNFWAEAFFPELKKRNIKQIIHLGDFFDKRQFVSVKSAYRFQHGFLKLLEQYDCKMELILGNHDILYRNTLEYNSPDYMFASTDRVNVIKEPTEFENILMVPWLTRENIDASFDAMHKTKAIYCFGHFEISGFELHKGQVHEGGLNKEVFAKFHKVLSGHFHTRSKSDNIEYVGSPLEMSWNDYDDPRGFHIFDTQTGQLEFVQYDNPLFFKVEYTDENLYWFPRQPDSLEKKFIKVIIKSRESFVTYDNFIKNLYANNPSDVQIFDLLETSTDNKLDTSITESLSNIEIISAKINSLDFKEPDKKAYLLKYMLNLYQESTKTI